MIRRWTAAALDKWLGWAVDPINGVFDVLLGPATSTFTDYASQSSASPGLFEQLVAIGFALLFIVIGVAGLYVILDLLSALVNPILSAATESKEKMRIDYLSIFWRISIDALREQFLLN